MAYQSIPGSGSGVQFLNCAFGDTTYTKVFVGGLAWETHSDTLYRYFEQFGEILEAVVITDKHTGRSKGYGFVTFCDIEATKRACADPSPVIDGRRANCNLASLGRPQPSLPYGRPRTTMLYFGNPHPPIRPYVGSPSYHQPFSYSYQPGLPYSPYGYPAYGPDYVYPQGVYNSYVGQHYLQMYGVPGTSNTNIFPYGQMGHPSRSNLGYATLQGYLMPGPHIMQYGRPSVVGATTEIFPTIQAPYHTGVAAPTQGQERITVPTRPPQFTQSSGSDQMAA